MKEQQPKPYTAKEKEAANKAAAQRQWLEDRKAEKEARRAVGKYFKK